MKPINLRDDEVRGFIDGTRRMVVRPVKPQPPSDATWAGRMTAPSDAKTHGKWFWMRGKFNSCDADMFESPFGSPGEQLWVREAWEFQCLGYSSNGETYWSSYALDYRAGGEGRDFSYEGPDGEHEDPYHDLAESGPLHGGWRPSVHMPRWASRLTLTTKSVRVVRVQEISEEDARALGIVDGGCMNCGESEPCGCADPKPDARDSFIRAWHEHHGKSYPWDSNPWAWLGEMEVSK